MPRVAFTIGYRPKAGPYVAALHSAGLEVEVFTHDSPPASLDGFAGLVLGGGSDVHPSFYGEEIDGTLKPDPERDEMELALVREAQERGLPILGICRGLQLLNVSYGGTLLQDIGAAHTKVRHEVEIAAGSQLYAIAGGPGYKVVSRHHQAIGRLGSELTVSARAADGIIEAVEDPARRFVVAVQWHPEDNTTAPEDLALFRAFAAAAGADGGV